MKVRKSSVFGADLDDDLNKGIAPDAFEDDLDDLEMDDEAIGDTLDTISDKVDDIQDTVDDIQEDDVDIEMDNNITGHYIAECERCHGIFISALVESDQEVESIHGLCPLCDHETEQDLKWVVRDAKE